MGVAKIKSYLAAIDLPCNLEQLLGNGYLVGGSVRDALLKRYRKPIDLDFVLPEGTIATARKIAQLYDAGFVVLDREREIARVVFNQGTLDLAKQEGASLNEDLKRRDFSINAMAYHMEEQKLIDPLGGITDLQQGILRMVESQNLEADPLRLLRAYRQAAQLNFQLDTDTRKAICIRRTLLKTVAAERIQAELNYMIAAPQGEQWLKRAIADGLFDFWLPYGAQVVAGELEDLARGIKGCFQLGLNEPDLALLSYLATLVTPEPDIAEAELRRLKYARNQIKAVVKAVKFLPQLQQLSAPLSLRQQYYWFVEVKDIFPLLMVRAIATDVSSAVIQPLIERYLNPQDLVAHPPALVSGNDLIRQLNLSPSPLIGKLLTEIQLAQIEAKIFTPQQAIDFAQNILQSSE
ncbi:MAG: CCA tRNA nucleotidyltransferase [Cyanobacteria bacterium J06621_8]